MFVYENREEVVKKIHPSDSSENLSEKGEQMYMLFCFENFKNFAIQKSHIQNVKIRKFH